jgi:hypothetical protein
LYRISGLLRFARNDGLNDQETSMQAFLSGAITMGFVIAGLFFLRFWRKTGDTLFVYFGISFWLLAAGQAAPLVLDIPREDQSWIYLIRLSGFVVLIIAIVGKNLGRARALQDK